MSRYEVEQKYRIKSPRPYRSKLRALKARKMFASREYNVIYDRGRELYEKQNLLRLRHYGGREAVLTFKGPKMGGRYKRRLEWETPVERKSAAEIIAALGYRKAAGYNKIREEYLVAGIHVTIDRLIGVGWFLEIEGPSRQIAAVEKKLGLTAADREERTYLELLEAKKSSNKSH